jgi:mono/diheme cytochrome c family protein
MRRLGLLVLAACGGSAGITGTATPSSTSKLPLGCEVDVVTSGRLVFVFDHDKASIVRAGEVVGRADPPIRNGVPTRWEAATALEGPDGQRWVVGLAGGSLWRVTSSGDLEPIGDRLGIGSTRVLSVDGAGPTFAIGLVGGVAVSHDGFHLMRFATGGDVPFVAAAADRVAVGTASAVDVFDLAHGSRIHYATDGLSSVAFLDATTDHPRLVVTASNATYIEDAGQLRRVTTPSRVLRTVVSGSRVWMLGRAQLFSLEHRDSVRIDAPVHDGDRIFSGGSGGVWLANATLVRYAFENAAERATWQAEVAPVFQRTCSKCHLAGGAAELDLSTAAAWREHAADIREAIETRSMPPPETAISDPDREALERWLTR